MHPRQLLEENLPLLERLVGHACRRVGIAPDRVEDFASMVKLELLQNDYAVLRRWEGRSSLATYLTIVIQRRLADERERTHGRRSAEARQTGETPRPRMLELPIDDTAPIAAAERADTRTVDRELHQTAARAGALLRGLMEEWPAEDRMLVRLRFESSLSIADAARVLGVPQRPLYRRMETLLARLRDGLRAAGIDAAAADDLVGAGNRIDVDFGLAWKNGGTHRTNESSGRATAEEESP